MRDFGIDLPGPSFIGPRRPTIDGAVEDKRYVAERRVP